MADTSSSKRGRTVLAGHRAYISCLFCDLRGFTAFAETAVAEELLDVMRGYHGASACSIPAFEGTLEHFAGDGLMVFFNDPLAVESHELKAVRLALAAQERFARMAGWGKRGTELGLGIGIEAGYATLGRIGFEGRYDYGALGPVTNLASRRTAPMRLQGRSSSANAFSPPWRRPSKRFPVGLESTSKGFGRPKAAHEVRGLR